MKIHPVIKTIGLIFLVIALAFNMFGCGSSSGREDSDGGGETEATPTPDSGVEKNPAGDVTISTTTKTLTADGADSTELSVMVTDKDGEVIDGEKITFTITQGSGRFTETDSGAMSTTATSAAGLATATFYASTDEGPVTVTATAENNVSGDIQLNLAKGTITLRAEPDELIADGISYSMIAATLTGPDGKLVENTVSVDFMITGGTGGLPYSNESRWNTTSGGRVAVEYQASETPGLVTIEAIATGYVTGVTQIQLTTSRIVMNATPSQILADGQATSAISAWVTDRYGAAVNGETVDFTILSGGGGLPVTPSMRGTTSDGVVSVDYQSPTTAGTAVIEAVTASGSTAQISIMLIQEAIGSVTLTSAQPSIEADGVSTVTMMAQISTVSGAAPPPGTPITFMTTLGSFPGGGSLVTPDESGSVSIPLLSSTTPGIAEVSCLVSGISQKTTVEFTGSGSTAPTAVIQMNASSESTEIDGEPIVVQATVFSPNNEAISGAPVTFSTNLGTLSIASATTNSAGMVQTQLTPGSTPGIATIIATASDVSSRVRVNFTQEGGGDAGNPPAFINLTVNPNPVLAGHSTQLTAEIMDGIGSSVASGTSATFRVDSGLAFPNGNTEYTAETLDDSGSIIVSMLAGPDQATGTITCEVDSLVQRTTVEVIGETSVQPASLSLGISQPNVKSDSSDSSTIIATVLDENQVPIEGISVRFSTESETTGLPAGMLSGASVLTNENGIAEVVFSSGFSDRSNQIVNITATISGTSLEQSVPILITGSEITIAVQNTNLEITATPDDPGTTEIDGDRFHITEFAVTAYDAGGNEVHNAEVNFSFLNPNTREPLDNVVYVANLDDEATRVDVGFTTLGVYTGKIIAPIDNNPGGEVLFRVESLGTVREVAVSVGVAGNVFRIIEPPEEMEPHSFKVGDPPLTIVVRSPDGNPVRFSTSFGYFNGSPTTQVTDPLPPDNFEASVEFSADEAGVATIQVYEEDNPDKSDQITVYVSAEDASVIDVQASSTVMAPSIEGQTNKVTITATVRNDEDQVVGNEPVAFSIVEPTGGGEYLSPVVVYTDQYGVAETEFFSGTLSTDSSGVTVRASLVHNSAASDTVAIVIGQTPGSVHITVSTDIRDDADGTVYILPASVLVLDSNGNPVSGANVTLSSWPLGYYQGFITTCAAGCCVSTTTFDPILNEDENKNLIMDLGEDLNEDGELTPINSAAASVPSNVITGANGVATFDLTYLKASAAWIHEELSASAVVFGTETQTVYDFQLPWMEGEECNLSHSPYNPTGTSAEYTVTVTAQPETIAAGGQSTITAEITDPAGNPFNGQINVSFSSPCVQNGTATIDASALTVNGVATVVYRAAGCVGDDIITATTDPIGGTNYSEEVTVTVLEPEIGSIQFNGADPTNIALRGSGGLGRSETSLVTFTVRDESGNPTRGIAVTFWLETTIGGAEVSPVWDDAHSEGSQTEDAFVSTVRSNQEGQVTALVSSGYCPGDIKVVATIVDIDDTNPDIGTLGVIGTGSDVLVASTGIPDQNSFSLSLSSHNPEGWDYDNETITASVIVSDHANNPVPDGTAVYFTTEGGVVEPSCTTVNGKCSVTWSSANPRPTDPGDEGRVTLLATTIGEESFADYNGDCRFDDNDGHATLGYDLPEAFRNDNQNFDLEGNPIHDSFEEFLDFNNDGLFTGVNGRYNGTRCESGCALGTADDPLLIHVRASQYFVMSGSYANVQFIDQATGNLPESNDPIPVPGVIDLTGFTGSQVINVIIDVSDVNGNAMPQGTSIRINVTNGDLKTTTTGYTIPSMVGPWREVFTLGAEEPPDLESTGLFEVEVTTPNGIVTIQSIPVIDDL